ncbi:helix-turn-helix domain-containing protein, partial [Limosilactobacillus reuteri]
MPGRELIKKYLKERSISIADLAKAYGLARQDVTDYLSGRNTSPKSNQFVLKV